MFRRFKKWITGRLSGIPVSEQQITHGPERFVTIASTDPNFDDDDIDPLMLAAMNRCLQTGGMVFGGRDENGNCTIEDVGGNT